MTKYIIVVVLVIILIFIWKYSDKSENLINQHIEYFDFGEHGPKICLIAGVHGNEPAASILFSQLLKTNYFQNMAKKNNCQIRVIPWVNKIGLANNDRYQPGEYPDINRNFTEKGEGIEPVSQNLILLLQQSDLIIDFHEGWGYYLMDANSIGSTLLPTPNMRPLANKIMHKLNENITDQLKKFMVIDKLCEIPNALDCVMYKTNRNYILIETTGQNNKQPLDLRINQIKTILSVLFNIKK